MIASAGNSAHCSARMNSAESRDSSGSWPRARRIASLFHNSTDAGTAKRKAAHNAMRTVRRTSRTECRRAPSSAATSGAAAVTRPMPVNSSTLNKLTASAEAASSRAPSRPIMMTSVE